MKCTAKTKKGNRCQASAQPGSKLCFAHGKPEEANAALEKARFKLSSMTPEERAEARRNKRRELDLLSQALNEKAEEVVEELMHLALEAEKAVVVSGSRDQPGWVEMVPDDDLRLKAITALLDRVHGKPAQGVKISGDPDAEPIRIAPERSEDRAARVAQILMRQGAIPTTAKDAA